MVVDSRRVITLARRGIVSLRLAAGTSIECTRGCLWLTEDGCVKDVVLEPGDAWEATRERTVLASALREESVFAVRDPAAPRPAPSLAVRLCRWLGGAPRPAPV